MEENEIIDSHNDNDINYHQSIFTYRFNKSARWAYALVVLTFLSTTFSVISTQFFPNTNNKALELSAFENSILVIYAFLSFLGIYYLWIFAKNGFDYFKTGSKEKFITALTGLKRYFIILLIGFVVNFEFDVVFRFFNLASFTK